MNWKKLFLNVAIGGVAGTAASCAQTNMGGGHCAWTAGNILLPVAGSVIPTIIALFQKPPHVAQSKYVRIP